MRRKTAVIWGRFIIARMREDEEEREDTENIWEQKKEREINGTENKRITFLDI